MKPRPMVQGLHKTPMRALTIKRTLWLSQDLNRRVREQHDRILKLYPSVTRNLHEFMAQLLETAVTHMEQEEMRDNLVIDPGRTLSPEEFRDISARLDAIKEGKNG